MMDRNIERADTKDSRRPWLLEYRSSNYFILATVCVAIFTDAFLYGVIVPVLPFSLQERSGVPKDQVQWWNSLIFAVFGAATLLGSPICGWIADHTSNRSVPFYTGLIMLFLATLLFGVAKASWVLLVSRLLQGFSAAITYSVGLALLVDTVGRNDVGKWMGTALSSSSFGLIVSPLLGGIVYAKRGYMSVFAMCMALIVFDILMRLCMIEKKTAAKFLLTEEVHQQNSFYGTFTDDGSNKSQQTVRQDDSQRPVSDLERAQSLNEAAGKTVSKKTRMPATLILLSMPRLLAAIYGIFVNISIQTAFDGILPLYVKEIFDFDSLTAGLLFLCLAIPAMTGPLVGHLADRLGPRWIAVTGCSLSAPPLILLRLVDHDSLYQKIILCVILTICGSTMILFVSPLAADLSAVVEEKEKADPDVFGPGGAYAQAFALFNSSVAAATLFGPVAAAALKERFGWGGVTASMGIFAISGAVPTLLFIDGWVFERKKSVRSA